MTLYSPVARPHVVCSINAVLGTVVLLMTFEVRHNDLMYALHIATELACVANIVLLLVLAVVFWRHTSLLAFGVTVLLCGVNFFVASMGLIV